MSECYDCGEVFNGYDDCPACGSQNIGILERSEDEKEEVAENPHFWDDYDEELPESLE